MSPLFSILSRRRNSVATFVFVFALSSATPWAAEDGAQPLIALKAAHLFDGKSKALIANGVVLVQSGIIQAAGADVPIPADAKVIELGDATLSPGFIDAHTHLTTDYSLPYNERRLRELETEIPFAAYEAIPSAGKDARCRLYYGARCRKQEDFMDVALRDMRSQRISCVGPRMLCATKGIGASGGHFDYTNGGFRDMLFGHANQIIRMGWQTDRKRFARRSAIRSRTALM